MKVSEAMTAKPVYCTRNTDLAAAAELFWNGNCGFLPVVDAGRVIGAVTDRDVCIALGTRNRPAGEIRVGEIAAEAAAASPATCAPSDDLRSALNKMAERKVHRLIVVGSKGELEGVLSADDVLAKAAAPNGASKPDGEFIAPAELISGLREIVSRQVHQSEPAPARGDRKAARRQA